MAANKFSERSLQEELLDMPGIRLADIHQNMRELETINKYLGGHATCIRGCEQLLKNPSAITICEIGCGGGDNLEMIQKHYAKKGVTVNIIGIDKNVHCLAVARAKKLPNARWILNSYEAVSFNNQLPDIIFSSLFCHHFKDEELLSQFQWMHTNSKAGFFVNDLHRHPIAYYSIKYLTLLFSKSYLVKHDAPLSVRRAFTKTNLEQLIGQLNLPYHLEWRWIYRWLLVVNKSEHRGGN